MSPDERTAAALLAVVVITAAWLWWALAFQRRAYRASGLTDVSWWAVSGEVRRARRGPVPEDLAVRRRAIGVIGRRLAEVRRTSRWLVPVVVGMVFVQIGLVMVSLGSSGVLGGAVALALLAQNLWERRILTSRLAKLEDAEFADVPTAPPSPR